MKTEDAAIVQKAVESLSETRTKLLYFSAEAKEDEVKEQLQEAYHHTLKIAADLEWWLNHKEQD